MSDQLLVNKLQEIDAIDSFDLNKPEPTVVLTQHEIRRVLRWRKNHEKWCQVEQVAHLIKGIL